MRAGVGIVGGLSLLGLAACGPSPSAEPAEPPVDVVGTWASDEEGEPFLEFGEDESVTGSDGCNDISTTYSVEGTTVTLEPFVSTLKACSGVDPWLSDVSSAEIDGETLVVMDAEGQEIGTLSRS